jgi:protein HIRA/HIR1
LRQHNGDVLDLAWSPGDRWLATCSVDNTVVIWDLTEAPVITSLAVLRGHSGHVKGVTWDPVGKYLATQSADKTLRWEKLLSSTSSYFLNSTSFNALIN